LERIRAEYFKGFKGEKIFGSEAEILNRGRKNKGQEDRGTWLGTLNIQEKT
jgi:hypothetical protein